MIKLLNTALSGLKIIETNHFCDERGVFHKYFSKDEFNNLGLESDFKEAYYSINQKNVIRGMHFQIPPANHTKLVYVTSGRILDVCLDIRRDSSSYGKYFSIELSGDKAQCLYIPSGFAHGFKSLENNTCVHYLQTTCYNASCDMGLRYDSFGFEWGEGEFIISARDKEHIEFQNFISPFKEGCKNV